MRRNSVKNSCIKGLTGLILALSAALPVQAQELFELNPADMSHPYAVLANPAAVSVGDARLVVGSRVLHYGFLQGSALGLQQSYFHAGLPSVKNSRLGLGLTGQRIGAQIWHQVGLRGIVSFLITENIRFALSAGLLGSGFDRNRFELVDDQDPVFADRAMRYAFDAGFGVYYRYSDRLTFALSGERLNRPDIALGEGSLRLPRALNSGFTYRIGWWELGAGVRSFDESLRAFAVLNASVQGVGTVSLRMSTAASSLSTTLHISRRWSMNYDYTREFSELATFTGGTHGFTLSYRFGETDYVQYAAVLSADSLRIHEKRVAVQVEPESAGSEFAEHLAAVYAASYEGEAHRAFYQFTPGDSAAPLPAIDLGPYLDKYGSLFRELAARLEDRTLTLRLLIPRGKESVARSICDYFIAELGVLPEQIEYGYASLFSQPQLTAKNAPTAQRKDQQEPQLSTPFLGIRIFPLARQNYVRFSKVRSWAVRIFDSKKREIRVFHGRHPIPDYLEWDWRDQKGELIGAGKYRVELEWTDRDGRERQAPPRQVIVTRAVRDVRVNVQKELLTQAQNRANRIDLRLGLK